MAQRRGFRQTDRNSKGYHSLLFSPLGMTDITELKRAEELQARRARQAAYGFLKLDGRARFDHMPIVRP